MTESTAAAASLRAAQSGEAEQLSGLAFRAKAYWGYPPEFMAACRDELRVDPRRIEAGESRVRVAEIEGRASGFYILDPPRHGACELDALFVEPERIGQGIGSALMADAIREARAFGADRVVIQGDPHADGFYRAAGAVQVGERASDSIPGRSLPLYEIDLGIASNPRSTYTGTNKASGNRQCTAAD